jgi:hypothetical protein
MIHLAIKWICKHLSDFSRVFHEYFKILMKTIEMYHLDSVIKCTWDENFGVWKWLSMNTYISYDFSWTLCLLLWNTELLTDMYRHYPLYIILWQLFFKYETRYYQHKYWRYNRHSIIDQFYDGFFILSLATTRQSTKRRIIEVSSCRLQITPNGALSRGVLPCWRFIDWLEWKNSLICTLMLARVTAR